MGLQVTGGHWTGHKVHTPPLCRMSVPGNPQPGGVWWAAHPLLLSTANPPPAASASTDMAGSAEPSRDPQAPPRIELVNTCPSPQQRTCGPAPHCSSTTRCSFLEASDPCDSPVRNVPSPPPFPRPPTPTPSLKTRVRLDPMSPPGRRLPQLQPPGPDAALQGARRDRPGASRDRPGN
jgi:hypothetical protein